VLLDLDILRMRRRWEQNVGYMIIHGQEGIERGSTLSYITAWIDGMVAAFKVISDEQCARKGPKSGLLYYIHVNGHKRRSLSTPTNVSIPLCFVFLCKCLMGIPDPERPLICFDALKCISNWL